MRGVQRHGEKPAVLLLYTLPIPLYVIDENVRKDAWAAACRNGCPTSTYTHDDSATLFDAADVLYGLPSESFSYIPNVIEKLGVV